MDIQALEKILQTDRRQTKEKPITEAPLIVILMKCKVEQANMISVSVHLN